MSDFHFGERLPWRTPGFAAVSLPAQAPGIGATSAIFSLLYSVPRLRSRTLTRIFWRWSGPATKANGRDQHRALSRLAAPENRLPDSRRLDRRGVHPFDAEMD